MGYLKNVFFDAESDKAIKLAMDTYYLGPHFGPNMGKNRKIDLLWAGYGKNKKAM